MQNQMDLEQQLEFLTNLQENNISLPQENNLGSYRPINPLTTPISAKQHQEELRQKYKEGYRKPKEKIQKKPKMSFEDELKYLENLEPYTFGQRALQPVAGAASTYGALADLAIQPSSAAKYQEELYKKYGSKNKLPEIPLMQEALPAQVEKLAGRSLKPSESDTLGKWLYGTGEFVAPLPIPGASGFVGTGIKQIGKKGALKAVAKEAGKEALMASGASAMMQIPNITDPGTMGRAIEDITKATVGSYLGSKSPKIIPGLKGKEKILGPHLPKLSNAEKEVQDFFHSKFGTPEEAQKAFEEWHTYHSPQAVTARNEAYEAEKGALEQQNILNQQQYESQLAAQKKGFQETIPSNQGIEHTQEQIGARKLALEEQHKLDADRKFKELEEDIAQYQERSNPLETATQTRTALQSKVDEFKKAREEVTQPFIDTINDSSEKIGTSNLDEALNVTHANESGARKRLLSKTKGEKAKTEGFIPSKEGTDAVNLLKKDFPDVGAELENLLSSKNISKLPPTPSQLWSLYRGLNESSTAAYKAGNKAVGDLAKKLKNAITSDFKTNASSEISNAFTNFNSEYSRYSKLISQIEKAPIFKGMLKKSYGEYVNNVASSTRKFLTGDDAIENINRLLPQLNNNPKLKQEWINNINNLILDEIPFTQGKVTEEAIHNFLKKYRGAEKIYPHLKTKLANTQNQNKLYHEILDQNSKNMKAFNKAKVGELLNENTDSVIDSLWSSKTKNPLSEINNIKKHLYEQDPTGQGWFSFQREVGDRLTQKMGTQSFDNIMNSRNGRNVLKTIYTPEQFSALELVQKTLKNPPAKIKQAAKQKFGANFNMENLLDEILSSKGETVVLRDITSKLLNYTKPGAGSAIKHIFNWRKQSKINAIRDTLSEALNNSNYASLLMTKRPDKVKTENFLKKASSEYKHGLYVGPKVLLQHQKEANQD